MHRSLALALLALVFAATADAQEAAAPAPAKESRAATAQETLAVQTAFTAYRKAVLHGDGDAAAALLSGSTHSYYDSIRRLALHGDEQAVRSLSLMNQMQVLLLRLRVPADQLEGQSAAQVIAHAVEQGWIGKNSVRTLAPGPVERDGEDAILQAEIDGYARGPVFRFIRESEGWKLDLVPAMKAGNTAFITTAQRRGISPQAFLRSQLKSALGHELDATAWEPPRPLP